MKDFLQSLTSCPFCEIDFEFEGSFRFVCHNAMHNDIKIWGYVNHAKIIKDFCIEVDDKYIIMFNLYNESTRISVLDDGGFPNYPDIKKFDQLVSFTFEQEKFKEKLNKIILFS